MRERAGLKAGEPFSVWGNGELHKLVKDSTSSSSFCSRPVTCFAARIRDR